MPIFSSRRRAWCGCCDDSDYAEHALRTVLHAVKTMCQWLVTWTAATIAASAANFVTKESAFHPVTVLVATVMAGASVAAAGLRVQPIEHSRLPTLATHEANVANLLAETHWSAVKAGGLSKREHRQVAAIAEHRQSSTRLVGSLTYALREWMRDLSRACRITAVQRCCESLSSCLDRTLLSPLGVQSMLVISSMATLGSLALDPPPTRMALAVPCAISVLQLLDVVATLPETIRHCAPATSRCLAKCTHAINTVLSGLGEQLQALVDLLTDILLRLVIILFPTPPQTGVLDRSRRLFRSSGLPSDNAACVCVARLPSCVALPFKYAYGLASVFGASLCHSPLKYLAICTSLILALEEMLELYPPLGGALDLGGQVLECLRLQRPHVRQHVVDHHLEIKLWLPAPIGARGRVVELLRPRRGDGLPEVGLVLDGEAGDRLADRRRELRRREGERTDIVRALAELALVGSHQVECASQ